MLEESTRQDMHSFCSFQKSHACTLLLHNAAVPAGVQQMETYTKLSFNPHHASTDGWISLLCLIQRKWLKYHFFYDNFHTDTLNYTTVATKIMICTFGVHIPAHHIQFLNQVRTLTWTHPALSGCSVGSREWFDGTGHFLQNSFWQNRRQCCP